MNYGVKQLLSNMAPRAMCVQEYKFLGVDQPRTLMSLEFKAFMLHHFVTLDTNDL
jgi:hypothetical protein